MKLSERYFTYDFRTTPLFGQFSAHSLSSRLDVIEAYVLNGCSRGDFLNEARHHVKNAITYLRIAESQWEKNIFGGSVEEVHDICLAAAHYSHSRLQPAFFAASLARRDCYERYANYLAIEKRYLERLLELKRYCDSPAYHLRVTAAPATGDIFEHVVTLYKQALTAFATELIEQLDETLKEFGTLD